MDRIRKLHRWNAYLIALFLIPHLINHMAAIFGIRAHLAFMNAIRPLYRGTLAEMVLIGLFIAQIGLGLLLAYRRGIPRGTWAYLQVLSGLYIVFFLAQHVPAILMARASTPPLDTNGYFAASVLQANPERLYFMPYYALAVAAIFTHLTAALRFRTWPRPAPVGVRLLPFLGLAVGVTIVFALTGYGRGIEMPPAYAAWAAWTARMFP